VKPFRPRDAIAVLAREGVEYIVIGGLGAVLHGANTFTRDLDICPRRSPANLERLARALRAMNARIRTEGVPEGLPFACDQTFFRAVAMLNLVTDHGDLDVSFQPVALGGYEDIVDRAQRLSLDGIETVVSSLEDIIRSKEAAGRPKDLAALPALHTLLTEIKRRERG